KTPASVANDRSGCTGLQCSTAMAATAELTSKLNHALAMRHIEEGFQILDEASRSFPEFDPHDAASAQFVLCIAEWVDAGYSDQRLIEMLLQKFPSERRRSM